MNSSYPEVGNILGTKYLIKSIIGKGATAQVYKVHHRYLQIEMAIKLLSPELAKKDKKAEDMFFEEACNLARMSHPNLIRIWDAEKIDNYCCIAMEIIEGDTLDNVIRNKISIEPSRAIKIIIEVCKALDHSLEHGLVHRDIKPSNIMVNNDNKVKIIDFGLSKKIGQPVKYQIIGGPMCGTLYYMAPEQLTDSDRVDHRADIYAVSITLYHMLIGKIPFVTDDLSELISMHMSITPTPPSDISTNVTPELSNIVMKNLEKIPSRRYQSYKELIADLEKALKHYDRPSMSVREAEQMNSLMINDENFILSNLKEKYLKKAKDKNTENDPIQEIDNNELNQKFLKNIGKTS